jgi:DNA polymerase-3 subunit epsilon
VALVVAIDFETASLRGTPCAVGLAEVECGRVIGRHSWLIRPPIFAFSPFNVALHGITPQMCESAAEWPQSLERIESIAAGRPLVAHNASFDIGVIRDACGLCEMEWPTFEYCCTLIIGRRVWPGLPTYSLPFLAEHLDIAAGDHHNAASDAETAAEILANAFEATETVDLDALLEASQSLMGALGPGE